MQLRYYLNENGKRVYTLESIVKAEGEEEEKPTFSAHPARPGAWIAEFVLDALGGRGDL
eukprot:s5967_g1.t1